MFRASQFALPALVIGCFCATVTVAQAPTLPADLSVLIGKQVTVGRLALCTPKTYTTDMTYAGKRATLAGISHQLGAVGLPMNPTVLRTMTPAVQAKMRDAQQGGTLLFRFADGKLLDTCVDLVWTQLAAQLEVVAGQSISNPPPEVEPVPGAAPDVGPQNCPVSVVKLKSSDGGMKHAFIESLLTSDFQREMDQSLHEGNAKHFLDASLRNDSKKDIRAVESAVIYTDRMGDVSSNSVLITQNRKPIKPGESYSSYAMDRDEWGQSGAGQVTLYISRVRYSDNTMWEDNGSHSCAMSTDSR